MLFSSRKKLVKDREAGLVFRWRGGTGTNRGGFTIAFLLTLIFFVTGFSLVRVKVKPEISPNRYRASIIQLGMMSDDLAWWIEKNSPYLDSWYEDMEALGGNSVNRKLMATIELENATPPAWRDVEIKSIELTVPSIFTKAEVEFPPLESLPQSSEQSVIQPQWQMVLHSEHADQVKRLPERRDYPLISNLPREWYGRSLSLLVQLNQAGEVLHTIPLKWSDDKTEQLIETWIQTLQFAPSARQQETIEVIVSIGAKKSMTEKADIERGDDDRD